jgi:polyribonucleotide nucleotidyltransferase
MLVRESVQFYGKELALETGQLARQANAAVLAIYGDTRVLVSVTHQENKRNLDYFPLRVDYEERFYAAGKIPGGFFKREGRPSDVATLSARMIDRPIRPLFPDGYNDEVQIVATVLSVEPDCNPGILGILGASAALMISEVPFSGPVAGVRIGLEDGRLAVNPEATSQEENGVEITIVGTKKTVTMVEGQMKELPEEELVEAADLAHRAIQEMLALQEKFVDRIQPRKVEFAPVIEDSVLRERVQSVVCPQFPSMHGFSTKRELNDFVASLREQAIETAITEEFSVEERTKLERRVSSLVDGFYGEYMRQGILERGERIDGRRPDDVRQISCEVGSLPRAHGSAVFTRGETQSLGVVTLGASRSDEQIIDQMMKEGRKRFMVHYNFPPFSVGEVSPLRGPSRRSIGHGYLAEGALRSVVPDEEDFPYTIRIVSEILESNGSSSMASVCSGSLAMMDAGVPTKKAIAGIAMGMVEDPISKKCVILTDITGDEDHYGDMDFKVAGTYDGVTAFQLDVKVGGISKETIREVLSKAKRARLIILDEMTRAIPAPREHLSSFAPSLVTINIPVEKIGAVIGPGGKMIRKIIEETGATIDIDDDGRVTLAGVDSEAVAAAQERIEDLTSELEVGTVIATKVTRVVDFGAFVELKNGSEGLVHVSHLASGYVDNVRDIVKPGDEITVEVIGEDKMGRPDLKRVEGEGESSGQERAKTSGKGRQRGKPAKPENRIKVGAVIEGTVANTTDYGAFVELGSDITGLIHISELSDNYVKRVEDVVKMGDRVTVEVLKIDERGRYKLRRIIPAEEKEKNDTKELDFEDRW